MMEEAQFEEDFEKYLNEALISCEKCHFCHNVCPIVDTRITQGPFGINSPVDTEGPLGDSCAPLWIRESPKGPSVSTGLFIMHYNGVNSLNNCGTSSTHALPVINV